MTDNQVGQWNVQFQEGKRWIQEKQWEKALEYFSAAEKIDSLFADLHFQKGKVFRAMGETQRAIASFKKAVKLDALPFRAKSWINPTIKSVGMELNIPVIDVEKYFIDHSNEGIPDPKLLLEHLHPNADGYFQMAQLIAKQISEKNFSAIFKSPPIRSLGYYLEKLNIDQLSINKVEYDLCIKGNYLERLSVFNPEARQYVFDVCTRAYDDAVRIRDEYLKSQGEKW